MASEHIYKTYIESVCQYLKSEFTSYHELVPQQGGDYILIFELEMTLIVDLIKYKYNNYKFHHELAIFLTFMSQ